MPQLLLPFCLLLHGYRGRKTGICFVDRAKLAVCHNTRIRRNKVFQELAQRVPTSWAGSLASSSIYSPITRARSWPSRPRGQYGKSANCLEPRIAALRGKGVDDRGSHCQVPHETPMAAGSPPAHWHSPHMKNHHLLLLDELPRKRSIIETLLARLNSGMGAQPPPLSPQCFCPYPLLSGGLLPRPTQGQHRHSPHP